jgi:hypothetical protein
VAVQDDLFDHRFRVENELLEEEFLAELGDSAAKVVELAVSAADEAAKLRAAELVTHNGVIDRAVGHLRHIEEMPADKLNLFVRTQAQPFVSASFEGGE